MSNVLGGSTLLYKNRVHSEFQELDYESDDYVIYPDVIRRNWRYYLPMGGNVFSGSDYPTSGGTGNVTGYPAAPAQSPSNICEFLIANNSITDPSSYRMTFKCYVGANSQAGTPDVLPNAALAQYAHSVFNQLLVRFQGGSGSSVIEQVLSYNVFCNMLYKFYTTNYVQKIQLTQEGYQPLPTNRQWQGRGFALPLNVGFFLTLRKYIPNCILPQIYIAFYMETVARAVVAANASTVGGTGGSAINTQPYYFISNVQLLVSEVNVANEKIDMMRRRVSERQNSDPVRLDFSSWQFFNFNVPANTSGQYTATITGNFVGLRKFMFGMINSIDTAAAFGDSLNNFTLQTLTSYRLQINGNFYPTQDVYVNEGGTASTAGKTENGAVGYFFNMFALGINHNTWSDMMMNWSSASADDAIYDWVFLISTEFDDAGMPILHDAINSGPLNLILTFNGLINGNNTGTNVYAFANMHKCIMIYEGNRAEVISG